MKKIAVLIVLFLSLVLALTACGGGDGTEANTSEKPAPDSTTAKTTTEATTAQQNDPTLLTITGVTFADKTVVYDGSEQSIAVAGTLPAGASVAYTNEKGTDAGTYAASATITCEGYNPLTLNATLTVNPATITGVSLSNGTFGYDGQVHRIEVTGALPAGVSAVYAGGQNGNSATDAGTYPITATLSGKNYVTLTLNATLTVNTCPITGVTFEGASFEYDGLAHQITVTGNVPAGVSVVYSGGQDGQNGATDSGSYQITASLSGKNYTSLVLNATLKIKFTEEPLAVGFAGNKIYFQNPLDQNRLYYVNGTTPTFVSRDVAIGMATKGNKLYFITENLLSKSISCVESDGSVTSLLNVGASSLASDGTYLYYSVNALLGKSNGIYRVAIADLENESIDPVPTLLTAVKTDEIAVADGKVWFANASDGGKLYMIPTTANNGTATKIYDYKVSDLEVDGTILYFTRELTLSNLSADIAIYSINLSGVNSLLTNDSAAVKRITVSKGKYLTVLNDYLFFVNVDKVTGGLFGDGVYKASLSGQGLAEDVLTLFSGANKVIDAEDNPIYALTSDGTYLYYFRANNKHLYRYDPSTEQETDLMAGFVPTEPEKVITTYYAKTQIVGNDVYYINMRDGGKLYRYNTVADSDSRITADEVADFAVHDGYLYYSTIRHRTNFDFYRMNLTTGENELLSNGKCVNYTFDDTYIYYNAMSGSNTLNRMKLDGTEDTVLFSTKSTDWNDITLYENKLYFVASDTLYAYDLSTSTAAVVNSNLCPLEYLIHDGRIYFMQTKGIKNSIGVYDMATNEIKNLGSLGVSGISDDLRGFFVKGDYVYFYRNVAAGSSNLGLYRINTKTAFASLSETSVELVNTCDGYYVCESSLAANGNDVYFLNVWKVKDKVPASTATTVARLCVLHLDTMTFEQLN